tara:strand:+ start:198 stop:500 length:303 start_codon:yes stop_codon:yes gene_type:complete
LKKFFSCFFIFLLFVPHILSWGHVIDHEHEVYDNQLANVHEEEAKCYVCLLTRNSLDLSLSVSLALFLLIFVRLAKDFSFNNYLDNTPFYVNNLRGPPVV